MLLLCWLSDLPYDMPATVINMSMPTRKYASDTHQPKRNTYATFPHVTRRPGDKKTTSLIKGCHVFQQPQLHSVHDTYKRDYDAFLQLESYGIFVHFGNISQNTMFIKCWEHCDILTQSQKDHCNIWRTEAQSKIITITILCKHPSPLTSCLVIHKSLFVTFCIHLFPFVLTWRHCCQ